MDEKKTYCEVIASKLKNKMVEIYLGDLYETKNYADTDRSLYFMICGKIIDAEGDCLIVDCLYLDEKNKSTHLGNIAYINGYSIKSLTKLKNGTTEDMFMTPKYSRRQSR